jgi:hypothetical protein
LGGGDPPGAPSERRTCGDGVVADEEEDVAAPSPAMAAAAMKVIWNARMWAAIRSCTCPVHGIQDDPQVSHRE